MKLIAGLGNPGAAYALTRHNIGFMAADRIAAAAGITLHKQSDATLSGRGTWFGHDIIVAEPLTFMNRSGTAIHEIARGFSLQNNDIIIIHDEMDFPFGSIRLKTRGGSGGHRGIASIIQSLASDSFIRLRVGIGRPAENSAGSEHVLEIFSEAELREIASLTGIVLQCLEIVLTRGITAAMNKFHKASEQNNDTKPL